MSPSGGSQGPLTLGILVGLAALVMLFTGGREAVTTRAVLTRVSAVPQSQLPFSAAGSSRTSAYNSHQQEFRVHNKTIAGLTVRVLPRDSTKSSGTFVIEALRTSVLEETAVFKLRIFGPQIKRLVPQYDRTRSTKKKLHFRAEYSDLCVPGRYGVELELMFAKHDPTLLTIPRQCQEPAGLRIQVQSANASLGTPEYLTIPDHACSEMILRSWVWNDTVRPDPPRTSAELLERFHEIKGSKDRKRLAYHGFPLNPLGKQRRWTADGDIATSTVYSDALLEYQNRVLMIGDSQTRLLHRCMAQLTGQCYTESTHAQCTQPFALGGLQFDWAFVRFSRFFDSFGKFPRQRRYQQSNYSSLLVNTGQWDISYAENSLLPLSTWSKRMTDLAAGLADAKAKFPYKKIAWISINPFPPAALASSKCPQDGWRDARTIPYFNDIATKAMIAQNITVLDTYAIASVLDDLSFDDAHYQDPIGSALVELVMEYLTDDTRDPRHWPDTSI